MSTLPELGYSVLGINDFIVLEIPNEHILVQGVLETIGPKMRVPAPAEELEFWLVCDNTTSDWTKG
jgi:hypothetical protein